MNNFSKFSIFMILGIGVTMSFIAGWQHEIILLFVSYAGILSGLLFIPKE